MRSLSYKEIKTNNNDYRFDEYIRYGGLPFIVNQATGADKQRELKKIYDEIYEADIQDRLEGKLDYLSKRHIDEILNLLAASLSLVSPSSIASRFAKGLDGSKYDHMKLLKEVEEVIFFLEKSFLIIPMAIDDLREDTPLENLGLNKKYYFTDNGLRYVNCLDYVRAESICLENAVYLELINRGTSPRGKLLLGPKNTVEGEIDFNFKDNKQEHHIQVTHTITENNYEREISNLENLPLDSKRIVIYQKDKVEKKAKGITYIKCEEFFN